MAASRSLTFIRHLFILRQLCLPPVVFPLPPLFRTVFFIDLYLFQCVRLDTLVITAVLIFRCWFSTKTFFWEVGGWGGEGVYLAAISITGCSCRVFSSYSIFTSSFFPIVWFEMCEGIRVSWWYIAFFSSVFFIRSAAIYIAWFSRQFSFLFFSISKYIDDHFIVFFWSLNYFHRHRCQDKNDYSKIQWIYSIGYPFIYHVVVFLVCLFVCLF